MISDILLQLISPPTWLTSTQQGAKKKYIWEKHPCKCQLWKLNFCYDNYFARINIYLVKRRYISLFFYWLQVKLWKWNNLPWIWMNLHVYASFYVTVKVPLQDVWAVKRKCCIQISDLVLNSALLTEEDENLDTRCRNLIFIAFVFISSRVGLCQTLHHQGWWGDIEVFFVIFLKTNQYCKF